MDKAREVQEELDFHLQQMYEEAKAICTLLANNRDSPPTISPELSFMIGGIWVLLGMEKDRMTARLNLHSCMKCNSQNPFSLTAEGVLCQDCIPKRG